ncbi:MAG: hypothetical protein ACLVJH_04530 [Faecalibacterium prausnitzii]
MVHYHLASGEDVRLLPCGCRSEVAKPLLADARFLQLHRSMRSTLRRRPALLRGALDAQRGTGAHPRGREPAVRAAFRAFLEG